MESTARFRLRLSLNASLALLLCLLYTSGVALAQTDPPALETLVVSGTRIPDLLRLPGASTVLDSDAIAARNDSNALDLFSDIPGVHANLPGGRGNVGELFIRGGEPNFATVLIDGVQFNDPTNTRGGSFDFSTLNIDDIERIELIRGPASSIYGSDALSGAINIITRSGGDSFSGTVDAEAGGGDYARGGLRLGGPVGASSRFNVGVGVIEDGSSNSDDQFDGHSFTSKFDLLQDGPTTISLYARHSSTDSSGFPDSSGGPELAVIREKLRRSSDDTSASLAVTSELSPRTALHFAATYFDHGEQVDSPGVAPGLGGGVPANRSDSEFSRSSFNLFAESELTARLNAAAGIGYQKEHGESVSEIDFAPGFTVPTRYDRSRDVLSAYAELGYETSNGLGILAAVRTDDLETAGRQSTGKIALDYGVADHRVNVRLAWANAFKLPSLFALADPLVGNPNLRPETAESWEAGLDLRPLNGSLLLQFTAFRQRFEDLIDFDFDSFSTVNRSQVETDGVEFGVRYEASERLSLSAHLTYTDIDVLDSDADLRQRPDLRGGLALQWWLSDEFSAHIGWQYIGERFDEAIPTGQQTLSSYSRLDIALAWTAANTIRLNFAVDNVSDADYEEAIGFPATGRRARFSIQKSFGAE